ncbi:MAG: hypothetical protein NVSMB9_21620 [Isosphaeraceae bacterium]
MDGRYGKMRRGLGSILFVVGLSSCTPGVSVEDLPPTDATLASAGKRLSQSFSAEYLTALATRGEKVLGALTGAERDALGRGYLRFRVESPAEVQVACPPGTVPFWLADLGFTRGGTAYVLEGAPWALYRKVYKTGWIGLGVNGLDRSPRGHYSVFVRGVDGARLELHGMSQDGWEAVDASDGVSLERGGSSVVGKLPSSLRGSTLLRRAHDHRHASLLARGKVWKTHVVSTRTPDQLTVSFGADPSTELVWSWRTSPEVTRSVVRAREVGQPKTATREMTGESTTIRVPDLLNDPLVRRHTVAVEKLRAGTVYEYSVGDGTTEGMSPWSTVRTGPVGPSDVCLLYMGDPQCGLEKWGKLLAEAHRRRPDANAILIAGDLVDRGNERTNWDHFFLRASGVFERLPLMPCIGNHEYLDRGPWLYGAFFTLPPNGPRGLPSDLVYHFEVGDAFVAVLDSTLAVSDPDAARLQADWLDECLSQTRKTWKVVMFHHPVYASHPSRESPSLRAAWVPIFDRHQVDLVLQGHDHAYLRTYPLRQGARARSANEGTVYVVSVSGDKYYEQDSRGYAEVGFTHISTYQTIDLLAREKRLRYRSFDSTGRQVDHFSMEKSTRDENRLERTVSRSRPREEDR